MLPNTDKENGHIRCVHKTDEGADHVTHSVTLGDDEPVEGTDGAEGRIEVTGLGDGVSADEGLSKEG